MIEQVVGGTISYSPNSKQVSALLFFEKEGQIHTSNLLKLEDGKEYDDFLIIKKLSELFSQDASVFCEKIGGYNYVTKNLQKNGHFEFAKNKKGIYVFFPKLKLTNGLKIKVYETNNFLQAMTDGFREFNDAIINSMENQQTF